MFEDLIEGLLAAPAGSSVFDELILVALKRSPAYDAEGSYGPYRMLPTYQQFTRRVDAALTLVAAELYVGMNRHPPHGLWYVAIGEHDGRALHTSGPRPTLPLAVCVAALRVLGR